MKFDLAPLAVTVVALPNTGIFHTTVDDNQCFFITKMRFSIATGSALRVCARNSTLLVIARHPRSASVLM